MRLIDADAIHKFVSDKVEQGKDGFANGIPYEWAYALTVIDHQPTFDFSQNWISVRDKLPKCNIEVLAISSEGTMRVCYYNGDWHGMLNSVDYWMPLPNPPRGGTHEEN